MRRSIALFVMLTVVLLVRAQFDAQIGQYMFLQSSFNPAAIGEGDLMRVYGSHRMDFTGIQDAPMTTCFSFSSPFVIGKTRHGVGVRFMNDKFGLFTNQSLYLEYAYKIQIGKGVLSVGADLGFLNLSFAVDSVDTGAGNDEYHDEMDPAIPNTTGGDEKGASGMGFDMGIGVYYSAPRWWASASYAHVTQPRLMWGSENTDVSVAGTMYLAGGYNWQLKNRDWMLLPSMMVMTDFASWDVNLTMLAQLKKRYRFGLGYRIAGSVNILLGLEIVNGLQLGYTYELPANALIKESFGSHELYLAYGFNILKPKNTNKYKSVRYL